MLGRETIQPIQLLLGTVHQCLERKNPDSWVRSLAQYLEEVHKLARDNLRVSQYRQKRDYDMRLVEHQYFLFTKLTHLLKLVTASRRCNVSNIPDTKSEGRSSYSS